MNQNKRKKEETLFFRLHCLFQVRTEEGEEEGCHPVIVRRPEARDLFWLPHGEPTEGRFINESIRLNESFPFASIKVSGQVLIFIMFYIMWLYAMLLKINLVN